MLLKSCLAISKGTKATICKIDNFSVVISICPKYYCAQLSCAKNSCGKI